MSGPTKRFEMSLIELTFAHDGTPMIEHGILNTADVSSDLRQSLRRVLLIKQSLPFRQPKVKFNTKLDLKPHQLPLRTQTQDYSDLPVQLGGIKDMLHHHRISNLRISRCPSSINIRMLRIHCKSDPCQDTSRLMSSPKHPISHTDSGMLHLTHPDKALRAVHLPLPATPQLLSCSWI